MTESLDTEPIHCYRCGEELVDREVEGRIRRRCPACGTVSYRNPKPCAGVLVTRDSSVLLVQRAAPPDVGSWGIPAGFLEVDEPPEEAAVRELREETGLEVPVDDIRLLDTVFKTHGDGSSALILIYQPETAVEGEPVPGSDASDAAFFDEPGLEGIEVEPGYGEVVYEALR